MKTALLALLARDGMVRLLSPLRPRAATIFCFHRFANPDVGNAGHDPAQLRASLAFLRRHRFHIVPLGSLVATLEAGDAPRSGTVAMTIDDGYADFANIAAPIFAEFDCPTTVFLVTGFLDNSLWLWWDQIEHIFRETPRTEIVLDLEGQPFRAQWATPAERRSEASRLAEALEGVSKSCLRAAIEEVAKQLEVVPPSNCPARFASMTWEDVRRCERSGTTFGPHTVTHPILSRVSAADGAFEVRESWARVRAQTTAAVPVFCYPNGGPPTFHARDIQAVRACGLRAAVTTTPRHVTRAAYAATADSPFLLPRFPYSDDLPHFAQAVSGTEWLKSAARSIAAGNGRPR